MRKVKVLAFVLAALMVVAAFAGCGTKQLKTDVSTLDERVTALETLLKQVSETVNGGATKDDITEILDAITANKAEAAAGDKTLADAIAKITADQATANAALKADLEKLVDAAKKDQAAGDTALQVAIEKLNNSLAATNKALEDSVKDLLEEIKDGDDANTKALADAINAINKAQADQTAASNKALEDAIKALQDSIKAGDDKNSEALLAAIEALNKKQDEQNAAIAEALAGLKETIEQNKEEAGVNASLQAAVTKYVNDLTVAKTTYDFELVHYTEADFAAINKAISTGIAAVQAATTVEAAKAAYDVAVAELAKYERVDVALYNAYLALYNKIDADSRLAIKAYNAAVVEALEHYEDDTAITAYVYAAGKTKNLQVEGNNFTAAYNYLVGQLIPRIEALVETIDAIERVQFYTLDKDHVSNVAEIVAANNDYGNGTTGVKAIITNTNTSRTDARKHGLYIADSVLDLVTNYKVLSGYVATVNALTKAEALLPTYADTDNAGNYKNVFAEYLSINVAKRNWFNAESAFKKINARIAAWVEDHPEMDAENAAAIINAYLAGSFTYETYLENEADMKLFVAAYNTFKNTLVPRIKAVGKFTEISTENVQTYIELRKDIEDWKIVVPDSDEDADKDPELKVDDAHYAQMCSSALSRSYDFKYDVAEVGNFFNGEVKTAEDVAAIINKKIDSLEAAAATALSLADYKELEGYIKGTETTDGIIYNLDDAVYTAAQAVAAGEDVTIAMFKSAFIYTSDEYSYDLTYLLDLDELAAAEVEVEARVATYKALTDKIASALDAIKVALYNVSDYTEDYDFDELDDAQIQVLLDSVSLNNEAAVNALKADYTTLTAKGYRPTATRVWVAMKDADNKVIEGQYMDTYLLDSDAIYEITGLANIVNKQRTMATNMIKYFNQVASANSFKKFAVDNMGTKAAVTAYSKSSVTFTDPNTGKDTTETTHKWTYVQKTNIFTSSSFTYKDTAPATSGMSSSQPNQSAISGSYSQFDAVETAWKAYAAFLAYNQGNTDAKVEAAIESAGMEDLKFQAIKSLAYAEINGVSETNAKEWQTSYGSFSQQKSIQLSAIKDATSLENVAIILHGFYEMTGAAYDTIDFADVVYFHTDGSLHVETVDEPCTHADHNTVNP